MDPGPIRTARARRGPARRRGSPSSCRSPTPPTTSPPACRPTTTSTNAEGGFARDAGPSTGVAPVTPDAFGAGRPRRRAPAPERGLRTLLVTGDSHVPAARPACSRGGWPAATRRRSSATRTSAPASPRPTLLDWGKLSVRQTGQDDAGRRRRLHRRQRGLRRSTASTCCGADWAAAYATRARTMMNTYRRDGDARVYWLTLPLPRDDDRQEIARVVNASVRAAAAAYRAHVRVLDMTTLFTPGGRYRDDMEVDGKRDARPRGGRHPPQRDGLGAGGGRRPGRDRRRTSRTSRRTRCSASSVNLTRLAAVLARVARVVLDRARRAASREHE